MVIALKIKLKLDGSLTKASMNRLLKSVSVQTGKFWHRFIFPKHFTAAAKVEYKYADRVGRRTKTSSRGSVYVIAGYEDKKFFKVGHRRQLDWSGKLKRQVTAGAKVRAVKKQSAGIVTIVTVTGPRYMHGGPLQPNKVAEMGAISPDDARKMARFMSTRMARELNRVKKFQPQQGHVA